MNWRSWAVIITLLWIGALAAYGGLLYPRIDEKYGMGGTLTAMLAIIVALIGVWWWAYTCARAAAAYPRPRTWPSGITR